MNHLIHTIPAQVYGTLFLLLGLFIRYLIGRRRFNRRGISGLQHYSGYERAVLTTFLEGLFGWLAIALIAAGLLVIISKS